MRCQGGSPRCSSRWPRIWAWIAGWKSIAFPGNYGNVNDYFWIPIIGPLVGAVIGGVIYDVGIRDVLIARGATPEPDAEERGTDVLEEPGGAASDRA